MNQHQEPPQDWAESQDRHEVARGEMAGMDLGMRVLSYLIAGVLVYGGLGWLGDHYLGTGFLLPIGIVLGAAGGCYVIIRRYGQVPGSSAGSTFQPPHQVGPATFDDKATRDQKATVDKRATVDKNTKGAR